MQLLPLSGPAVLGVAAYEGRVWSRTETALIEVLQLAEPIKLRRLGFTRCPEMYSVAIMISCSPLATAAG
jgi:hypothetical protein